MSFLWLYDSFKPYCDRLGIKLLSDDLRYITKVLSVIPEDRRKAIMKEYAHVWLKGMESAFFKHKAQNNGRRLANIFLNEVIGD